MSEDGRKINIEKVWNKNYFVQKSISKKYVKFGFLNDSSYFKLGFLNTEPIWADVELNSEQSGRFRNIPKK